jgi:uncharacterized protein involved in exopolysaccharide biosynthesis
MMNKWEEAEPSLRAPSGVIADYLRRSISISYLTGLVWSGRMIVIATAIVGLLYGIYSVNQAGPTYIATVRVSSAESDAGIGDVSSGGGAAGLLAGLTGGASSMALPKFTQFLSSMGSVGVARILIQRHDLLCRTFSSDCDLATHRWRERTGLREWFNGLLARLGGLPDPNGARTEIDLANYIGGSVTAETNKNNSLVSLHFAHRKPDTAARVLSQVVAATNDYIRIQNRENQKRYVAYLSESAAKATNVEQRQAIDTLLLQQERQLMMTEVDVPYAAKILDGPTVAPVNKVLKMLIIYTFIGMIIGIAIAVSRDLLPRKWRLW